MDNRLTKLEWRMLETLMAINEAWANNPVAFERVVPDETRIMLSNTLMYADYYGTMRETLAEEQKRC